MGSPSRRCGSLAITAGRPPFRRTTTTNAPLRHPAEESRHDRQVGGSHGVMGFAVGGQRQNSSEFTMRPTMPLDEAAWWAFVPLEVV